MAVGKEILRSYYESSLATKVAETMYKPMKQRAECKMIPWFVDWVPLIHCRISSVPGSPVAWDGCVKLARWRNSVHLFQTSGHNSLGCFYLHSFSALYELFLISLFKFLTTVKIIASVPLYLILLPSLSSLPVTVTYLFRSSNVRNISNGISNKRSFLTGGTVCPGGSICGYSVIQTER